MYLDAEIKFTRSFVRSLARRIHSSYLDDNIRDQDSNGAARAILIDCAEEAFQFGLWGRGRGSEWMAVAFSTPGFSLALSLSLSLFMDTHNCY